MSLVKTEFSQSFDDTQPDKLFQLNKILSAAKESILTCCDKNQDSFFVHPLRLIARLK